MTQQDQIKALAELDGWPEMPYADIKQYLTSYDAILPLVQKQQNIVVEQVICHCLDLGGHEPETKVCGMDLIGLFRMTPAQLCEALLRATGKWKE
jgi:hypothetical protein